MRSKKTDFPVRTFQIRGSSLSEKQRAEAVSHAVRQLAIDLTKVGVRALSGKAELRIAASGKLVSRKEASVKGATGKPVSRKQASAKQASRKTKQSGSKKLTIKQTATGSGNVSFASSFKSTDDQRKASMRHRNRA
jgi:Tfp pilus assembly major pilin PilA